MAAPHTCTLIRKKLPEVIFPDHNYQPKLKAEVGFVRKSVVFFSILYIYHDKLSRYNLMEEFTKKKTLFQLADMIIRCFRI